MDPIVFRAVRSIPELGIDAGDDVVMNPRAPRLFTHCRRVDPGAALNAYQLGALQPLAAAPLPADLAAAVGLSAPSPSTPPPPGSPELILLK